MLGLPAPYCTPWQYALHLPNRASLLVLLFLSLKILPLCFLPLLGLFKAFGLLPFMILAMLQFKFLFICVSFYVFDSHMSFQCWFNQYYIAINGFLVFFMLCFGPFFSFAAVFV